MPWIVMHGSDGYPTKNVGSHWVVSREEAERRSWIHKRAVTLYKEKYGTTEVVDNRRWEPLYKAAEQAWQKHDEESF